MSADYYIYAVYGVKFNRKRHSTKEKNPKFNPNAPFDAKTGKRVEEYIETGISKKHIENVARIHGLDVVSDTDGENLFIGRCSNRVDVNNETHIKLNMDHLGDFEVIMWRFCKDSGVPFDTFGHYAVCECSY